MFLTLNQSIKPRKQLTNPETFYWRPDRLDYDLDAIALLISDNFV
jgi:hypothetical protein